MSFMRMGSGFAFGASEAWRSFSHSQKDEISSTEMWCIVTMGWHQCEGPKGREKGFSPLMVGHWI